MANFIPEKNEKAKTPLGQPNTKANELSDDELGGVSGGVEQLRRGPNDESNNGSPEIPDDELDGVSGGTETDEEPDDEDNEPGGSKPRGYTQLK